MKSPKARFVGAILAVPALAAASCGGTSAGASNGGGKTVKIGVVLSTSGNGAVFGVDQRNGVNLAVKMINAGGGINGRLISVDFRDSAYDKTQAQAIFAKMAPDNSIVGIIGPTSSAEAFAADPLAVSAKLPVLAISNGSAGVPQIGKYVHRVGVPEPMLLPGVAKAVVARDHITSAAVMYASNDPFALTGYQAFSKTLKDAGVKITDVVPYDSDKTVNFTPQLQTIKGHHPQALFVAAKSNEGAVILRQAKQTGLSIPLVGNLSFTSTALLQAAGSAANGLIVGATWSASDTSALNQQFVAQYQQAYDKPATPLAATAFNAVYVIKQALSSATTDSRASLEQGLEQMPGYHFIGSAVDFVSVGNGLRDAATADPVLLQAKDGKLVPLG